jgi:hypothetical protein
MARGHVVRNLLVEGAKGLFVLFEFSDVVLEINSVLFQKGVDLQAILKTEKPTEVGFEQHSCAVTLESKRFKGYSRGIGSQGLDSARNVVRNVDFDFHHLRIARPGLTAPFVPMSNERVEAFDRSTPAKF